MLLPVIMSGGSGSRLWPLSRSARPKPYVHLPDGRTLIGATWQRAANLPDVANIMIVTNRDFLFLSADCIEDANTTGTAASYVLEPVARNTAAATALATLAAKDAHGDDCTILLMPADHLITDQAAFAKAVSRATELAAEGNIVTFGISPTHPETGYGYIEADGETVRRFVEKPDRPTAEAYLAGGRHLWNAGIFCFRASTMEQALAAFCPDILDAVRTAMAAATKRRERGAPITDCPRDLFAKTRSEAIDTAVMEKADNVKCVPVSCGWSDIGSWDAMATVLEPRENDMRVSGDVVAVESANSVIYGDNRLVALAGVRDLVVVDTPDAILVAHRDHSQSVKAVYQALEVAGHPAASHHRTIHRPWGSTTVLEIGTGFKVKRIVVKPGASLSMQAHEHRSEHWVVVDGTARIETEDESRTIHRHQSTYIEKGRRHRLINAGDTTLIIIETQTGATVSEDDIVRYDAPILPDG